MPQQETQMPFPSLIVNATSSTPLFCQLYESLWQSILDGQFVLIGVMMSWVMLSLDPMSNAIYAGWTDI
jgi:hypothetical protein